MLERKPYFNPKIESQKGFKGPYLFFCLFTVRAPDAFKQIHWKTLQNRSKPQSETGGYVFFLEEVQIDDGLGLPLAQRYQESVRPALFGGCQEV